MDFSKLKLPELKALCKQRGIAQYSKCNKQQLIDKLAAAGDGSSVTAGNGVATSTAQSDNLQEHQNNSTATQHRNAATASTPALAKTAEVRTTSDLSSSGQSAERCRTDSDRDGNTISDASQQEQVPVNGKKRKAPAKKASKQSDTVKKTKTNGIADVPTSTSANASGFSARLETVAASGIGATPLSNVKTSDPILARRDTATAVPGGRNTGANPSAGNHTASLADYEPSAGTTTPISTSAGAKQSKVALAKASLAKPLPLDQPPSSRSKDTSTTLPKVLTSTPASRSPVVLQPSTTTPAKSITQPRASTASTAVSLTSSTKIPSKRASAITLKPAPIKRARVQLLSVPKAPPPKPPASLAAPTSIDDATSNDTYIRSHFLFSAYAYMDAARDKPTKRAFPCLDRIGNHPGPAFRVAVRFVVARLHTLLQLGTVDFDSNWGYNVLGCEVVRGDVWRVKIQFDGDGASEGGKGKEEEYYVVGTTGEPIPPTRADWAARLAAPNARKWIDYVKTKDDVPYVKGKGTDEGLAERVVLANCALNSFSGDKLSALQMDSEYLGQPANHTSANLEFYLPESHQLLSLHSTPHPAILIAHLRLGSYYVLKDTGQMIGDEAGQGVVELWQGILGCTARAEVDRDVAGRFWNGWEGRVREKLEQRFD